MILIINELLPISPLSSTVLHKVIMFVERQVLPPPVAQMVWEEIFNDLN